MYNFAAAFSERISKLNFDVEPIPPGANGGSPAGGVGDENSGYRGARDAPRRGFGPDSARNNRLRGADARPRSRAAGRGPDLQRVSHSGHVHRQVDSAKDERNLKPPLTGLHVRRLLPLRRPRSNKVQPLTNDGSLTLPSTTARQPRPLPSAKDSAHRRGATPLPTTPSSLAAAAAPSNLVNSKLFVVGQSCKNSAPPLHERTSSCPPVKDDDVSPVIHGQVHLPQITRSRRPWTSRLQSLLVPRRRGIKTTVEPFESSQEPTRGRPRSQGGDHRDLAFRSRNILALKTKKSGKGAGGEEAPPAPVEMVHSRRGSAAVATRPAMASRPSSGYAPLPIPGVPQFDCDHQTVDRSSSPQELERASLIVNYDDRSHPTSSSVSVTNLDASTSQEPKTKDGDRACERGGAVLKLLGPSPVSKITTSESVSSPSPSSPKTVEGERGSGDRIPGDDTSVLEGVSPPSTSRHDVSTSIPRVSATTSPGPQSVKKAGDEASNDRTSVSSASGDDVSPSEVIPTSLSAQRVEPVEAMVDEDNSSKTGGSTPATLSSSNMSSAVKQERALDDAGTTSHLEGSPTKTEPKSSVRRSGATSSPSSSQEVRSVVFEHEDKTSDAGEVASSGPTATSPTDASSPAPASSSPSPTAEAATMEGGDRTSVHEDSISRPAQQRTPTDDSSSACPASQLAPTSQDHGEGSISNSELHAPSPVKDDIIPAPSAISSPSFTGAPAAKEEGIRVSGDGDAISEPNLKPEDSVHESSATTQQDTVVVVSSLRERPAGPPATSTTQAAGANCHRRTAKFPTLHEQRRALKMDVNVVMKRLSPDDLSQWLAVVMSCIKLRREMRRMMFAADVVLPYTREEAKEIELNGRKAKEMVGQLKHLTSVAIADAESKSKLEETSSPKALGEPSGKEQDKLTSETASENKMCHPGQQTAPASGPESSSRQEMSSGKPKPYHAACSKRPSGSTVNTTASQKGQASLSSVVQKTSPQNATKTSKKVSPPMGATGQQATVSNLPNGVPDLTAYPQIASSELEFLVSSSGKKVVLGRGNYGEVLLMRRQGDPTLLAVKVLTKSHHLMLQEVAAMQAISHCPFFPKFVGVIDYCSYAQELIGGLGPDTAYNFHLARYEYNLLTAREWLHVCRDIAQGMKALHDAGWLHNDLHCGNAMVCPNPPGSEVPWTGKIIDLGNSQKINVSRPIFVMSKEEQDHFYKFAKQCAPEILEGRTSFTVKSDIYSLGKLFVDVASSEPSLRCLKLFGEFSCMRRYAKTRPSMELIITKLEEFISEMAKAEPPPPAAAPQVPALPALPPSPSHRSPSKTSSRRQQ